MQGAMDRWERSHGFPASHTSHFSLSARVATAVLDAAGLRGDPRTWAATVIDPAVVGVAVATAAKKYRTFLSEMGIAVRKDVGMNPVPVVRALLGRMGAQLVERKRHGVRTYEVAGVENIASVSVRYLGRILERDPAGKLIRDPVVAEITSVLSPT